VNINKTDLPQYPHSKTIYPQSFWGQIYSMMTMTYERFLDLTPVPPLFFGMGAKKVALLMPEKQPLYVIQIGFNYLY